MKGSFNFDDTESSTIRYSCVCMETYKCTTLSHLRSKDFFVLKICSQVDYWNAVTQKDLTNLMTHSVVLYCITLYEWRHN